MAQNKDPYKNKVIWSRGKVEKGIITATSERYCAACGTHGLCVIAKWNDGKTTKPCVCGIIKENDEYVIR